MGVNGPPPEKPKPHWVIPNTDGSLTLLRDGAASYASGATPGAGVATGYAVTEEDARKIEKDKAEKKGGRHTRKWIQGVVKKMKKGSFTRDALRHHMIPSKYALDVLKHPKKHTLRTRRRALFLRNIRTRRH